MELTKTDIKNILAFLGRAQMSGAEAMTFVELVAKLNTMVDDCEGKKDEACN